MVVFVLRWNEQRAKKRFLNEQFLVRGGTGRTAIVRNKDVGLPGKSQQDLARFSRSSLDIPNSREIKKTRKRSQHFKSEGISSD